MASKFAEILARDSSKLMSLTESRLVALHWYREILRAGERWSGPEKEKEYIKMEARKLFRENKDLTDPEEIQKKLFEAESRYTLAVHYGIPYPRPYHLHPSQKKHANTPTIVPAYMDSYIPQAQKDKEKKRISDLQSEKEQSEHLDRISDYKDEF